tara:strand:- start:12845 stop:13069 length:225 start_codon:yes stop_codon:yes gene_type:complete
MKIGDRVIVFAAGFTVGSGNIKSIRGNDYLVAFEDRSGEVSVKHPPNKYCVTSIVLYKEYITMSAHDIQNLKEK